jgi:thiamine-phosphate pyrophosphorylase
MVAGKTPGRVPSPLGGEGVLRLLDANLNRAREGLRVLEDTARFVWKDAPLFAKLRQARHALDRATRRAYPDLVASRDSVRDMGRRMAEPHNRTPRGLVAANFRRVEEALRVLEEYGKVFSMDAVIEFKKLRFETYTMEKRILAPFLKLKLPMSRESKTGNHLRRRL